MGMRGAAKLYVLVPQSRDAFKIGISINPRERWEQVLSTAICPIESFWVLCTKKATKIERALHTMFSEHNMPRTGDGGTEWFEYACYPYVIRFLDEYGKQMGLAERTYLGEYLAAVEQQRAQREAERVERNRPRAEAADSRDVTPVQARWTEDEKKIAAAVKAMRDGYSLITGEDSVLGRVSWQWEGFKEELGHFLEGSWYGRGELRDDQIRSMASTLNRLFDGAVVISPFHPGRCREWFADRIAEVIAGRYDDKAAELFRHERMNAALIAVIEADRW